ncbi:hypothetical protein [Pedobacter frigiditerrae]|uniref:hypothetical protein n=1 Tax=Pedobacter frigiditerrae TaxID=2530452 RepID=UPI00292E2DB5|nr:hypothetical protein [Pedobacter frigiditerrae]
MVTKITERGSNGEQATLCVLLSRLGYHPAKSSGEELLYKNVLHKFEKVPTLVVNSQLGLWFDRLTKRSGDLLDFGMAFWAELSPLEVSEKIGQLCGPFKDLQARADKQHTRKRRAVKIPQYHIGEIRQLGGNSEISDFLKSKGIWEISFGHLKEVYYYVIDEKKKRKDFFAAGWENENGGWEVRGRNYSSCLGPKGMSFIQGQENKLVVFGNYTEYLNWRYEFKTSDASVLVLNDPDFLTAACKRLSKFKDVTIRAEERQLADQLNAVLNL